MNKRERFEEWLLRAHFLEGTWVESRNCYGEYACHLAFQAWCASQPAAPVQDDGYADAFYRIGEVMGLSASTASPMHVFETVMLPRLKTAFGAAPSRERKDEQEAMPLTDAQILAALHESGYTGPVGFAPKFAWLIVAEASRGWAEARASQPAAPVGEPVAWLHTLKQRDEDEEDHALSFAPDNFPLMDELPGMFQSIRREPLYTVLPPTLDDAYAEGRADQIEDDSLRQVIDERDSVEDMADQLAAQIAAITGVEIGEHSSANDPWRNALQAADDHIEGRKDQSEAMTLTDEQIVQVWQEMPGGPEGWLKNFGFIQFARAILAEASRG